MNSARRLIVERAIFYAMIVIMLLVRFVPSARCSLLAGVLIVLAFLYAVGAWWLLRRKGLLGFFQPFLIGWFGAIVPFIWGLRVAGFIGWALPWISFAIAVSVATWVVAAWASRRVENGLSVPFVSVRMGLFVLCGLLYLLW